MTALEKEKLIEEITKQVMQIMCKSEVGDTISNPNNGKTVLVLGDGVCPIKDCKTSSIEDYKCDGDISKYSSVFISTLTLFQLSDIAQCRDSSTFACAVLKALMNGVPVYISKKTFNSLQCEKINPTLNKKINENINALLSYKVKIFENVEEFAPKKEQLCKSTSAKIITEPDARKMCSSGDKTITLKKGTILTPLAKDYFAHNDILVDFE